MRFVCKFYGCDARTSIIGSSLDPMSWWGSSAPSAVAITFGALEVRLVHCPRWALASLFVLLRLFVLVALSDVKLVIIIVYCSSKLLIRRI